MRNNYYDNPTDSIPIVVLKTNGDFVGKFENIKDACFKLTLDYTNVIQCLKGFIASHKGYIFLKQENYDPLKMVTRKSILRKRNFLNKKT